MIDILFSLLGFGGVAALALFVFGPVVLFRALDFVLAAVTWLASTLVIGTLWIIKDWRAFFTLCFFAAGVGIYTDRYDPVRDRLPKWAQRPPAAKPLRPVTSKSDKPARDVFMCNFLPGMC
jgi:hypothetical protein